MRLPLLGPDLCVQQQPHSQENIPFPTGGSVLQGPHPLTRVSSLTHWMLRNTRGGRDGELGTGRRNLSFKAREQ